MAESQWSSSQQQVTSDNKSPLVGICTIVFAVTSGCALAGRLFTKSAVTRGLGADDGVIAVSWALSAAQSALVVTASQNGLGRISSSVTLAQQSLADKTIYAAELLFIAAIALAKVSVALFLARIAPWRSHEIAVRVFCAVIAIWAVASIFAAAFVCRADTLGFWGASSCFAHGAQFRNAFNALDLLSDVVLVIWPCWLFHTVQISVKRRLFVSFWFSMRILTVAAIITQLIYLNKLVGSPNRTFNAWRLMICTQATEALSIITACIPCLGPCLGGLSSGMLRSDNRHNRGGPSSAPASTQELRKISSTTTRLISRTEVSRSETGSLENLDRSSSLG